MGLLGPGTQLFAPEGEMGGLSFGTPDFISSTLVVSAPGWEASSEVGAIGAGSQTFPPGSEISSSPLRIEATVVVYSPDTAFASVPQFLGPLAVLFPPGMASEFLPDRIEPTLQLVPPEGEAGTRDDDLPIAQVRVGLSTQRVRIVVEG